MALKRMPTFKIAFALAILLALVFATTASTAGLITGGGNWQWSNPAVQGNTINSVSFIDENTGWAAGIGGTVIKTTDGGASWIAQIPSTSCNGVITSGCNLSGIHFISASEGWVVGEYGTIWHTTTGGDSWTSQTSGLPASGCSGAGGSCTQTDLRDVHFIDSLNGIAVGDGYAFSTVDGGATWARINTISSIYRLTSVHVTSPTNAVIVGAGGYICRVTLSGGIWTAAQKYSGTTEILNSVYFIDANNGFAVGGNKLLRSIDGGNSWSLGSLAGGTATLWGVTVSGNNLIAVGGTSGTSNGAIYKRTSATNWSDSISTVAAGLVATSTGTTSQLLAVSMPTTASGYAAGYAGAITKTTNAGSSWTLKAGGEAMQFSGISFIDEMTGWIAAMDGSVKKTVDSGASWFDDDAGIAAGTSLQAVQFLDAGTGFAVGYLGSNGVAYRYSSGSWSAMSLPAGVGSLWGIQMVSPTSGWAVGIPAAGATSGVALKTNDGVTWTLDAAGISPDIQLYDVDSFNPSSNGWAVGQRTGGKAVLMKYNGSTWTSMEKADTYFFTSIDMVDGSIGYVVGYDGGPPESGRGYKTVDGGGSWSSMPVGTSKLLSEVSFVDASNGYACGDEGRVIKTSNGGASWTFESTGSAIGMNAMTVLPSPSTPSGVTVFVAGFNGAVLRYGDPVTCSPEKPNLGLSLGNAFWNSYADYVARELTVPTVFTNRSSASAYNVKMTGAATNNGVTLSTTMPLNMGNINGGSSAEHGVRYHVPAGVGSFKVSLTGSASNACGDSFTYP